MSNKIWATEKLVPGQQFCMSAAELKKHLEGRAAYHRSRAESKSAELPKLKEAAEAIKKLPQEFANKSNSSNYNFRGEDAIESLEADIKRHKQSAAKFTWMAGHLFDDDYCLNWGDLSNLEIVQG